MARFEVSNDMMQVINDLNNLGLYDQDVEKEILVGCGDILVKKIKENFTGDWNTLDTFSHVICKPKIQRGSDGVPYVTVTVQGVRPDGQRYGTVAFVLNYGRRSEFGEIVGSHFWNRAIEQTEAAMKKHLEDVLNIKLKQKGMT